ncbi:hypothetical protein LguiA_013977 [Lonicera macranthoides]
METPSSARRITRSQALSAASNNNNIPMSRKTEESEKGVSKSRNRNGKQQDRSALIDITNDSPIVGIAMGSLGTPLSTMSKKRNNGEAKQNTPGSGSGEALLRGQVKTLLQKVEEEAELSKIPLENRADFICLKGLVNSPMGLLAPTPANTPQVSNLSSNESAYRIDLASVESSPIEEQFNLSQMVKEMLEGKKQETVATEDLITRSLLVDFSEKSEGSSVSSSDCISVLTYQGGSEDNTEKNKKSIEDDDDASIWSIQVNASSINEEEEEEEEFEGNYEEYDEEGEYDEGLVDDLCEGISNISVNGEKKIPQFAGKHTRFVYNSDDEIEGAEECGGSIESPVANSEGILHLKGLPTPKGKHVRFAE